MNTVRELAYVTVRARVLAVSRGVHLDRGVKTKRLRGGGLLPGRRAPLFPMCLRTVCPNGYPNSRSDSRTKSHRGDAEGTTTPWRQTHRTSARDDPYRSATQRKYPYFRPLNLNASAMLTGSGGPGQGRGREQGGGKRVDGVRRAG